MRDPRRITFVIFSILFLITGVSANDGLALLKVEPGAYPTGMGGAVVALRSSPDLISYNPAAAVGVNKFTASLGHTSLWNNIRIETGHLIWNLSDKMYLHSGIRFAAIDELELRGEQASEQPIGYFDAHDVSLKAGLAYQINDWLSSGFSMGAVMEKIEAWRGGTLAFDLGIQAQARDNITVGASATNLGSDFTLSKADRIDSRPISLPTAYRLGGAYTYQDYLGALEMVYLDEEAHLHLGAQVQVQQALQLRAGYMFNYDVKNFTAGASFTRYNIVVDYAFVPYKKDLGTSHMFNITFSL